MSYSELDRKFSDLEQRVRELEKLNGHLARQAREYFLLYESTRQLFHCATRKEFFEKLASLLKSKFNVDEFGFITYNPKGNILNIPYSTGLPRTHLKEIFYRPENSLVGKVFTEQACVYLPNLAEIANFSYYFETKKINGSIFYLPLSSTAGNKLGVIKLRKYAKEGFSESERKVLQRLRTEISDAWYRLKLDENPAAELFKEPHTGLFNKRYFAEIFPAEFKRAQRYQRHFSMISIDFTSSSQDLVLLNSIIDSLRGILRKSDLLIHYSPNQLLFLLPETNRPAAREVIQKINGVLFNFTEKFKKSPALKFCSYPEDSIEKDDLLKIIL
ncbi:MAG: hypothetical protein Kow0037_04290 [Calditrichia bacterium]